MFSPDELAQLKDQLLKPDDGPNKRKPQGQARPNVLFGAGPAMGWRPAKTVLVTWVGARLFAVGRGYAAIPM